MKMQTGIPFQCVLSPEPAQGVSKPVPSLLQQSVTKIQSMLAPSNFIHTKKTTCP